MAGTYAKIQIQIVFGVKYRAALIQPSWEVELHKYIAGIIEKRGHKLLAINGMPDHIHILIGYRPMEGLSDLVREIKKASTEFIKAKKFTPYKFQWQEGYGAFSYSEDDIKNVVRYILNQKEHHRKVTFTEEYVRFLKDFNVDYVPEYLLKDPE
jgi:putative transposase